MKNYLVKTKPTWKEAVEKSLSEEEMLALDISVEIISKIMDIRDNNILDRESNMMVNELLESLLDVPVDQLILTLVSLGYKIELVKI